MRAYNYQRLGSFRPPPSNVVHHFPTQQAFTTSQQAFTTSQQASTTSQQASTTSQQSSAAALPTTELVDGLRRCLGIYEGMSDDSVNTDPHRDNL